ncbi:MAG: APC family permease [Solirubrobacterales bacterium]|nr:APC family permease [Solirubrobacterales bacterium]
MPDPAGPAGRGMAGRGSPEPEHRRRHSPRAEHRARSGGKLGLRESSAMAIGGMIGGGIFSVLGLTIVLAGHLAFLCFALGGVIAGLTAHAYARLADQSGRSGGPFTYLRDAGHPRAGAWVAWLLIVGYVFALAVYAFTFGHYLANLLGLPATAARLASTAVLAAFVTVNLRGVVTSGLVEDVIVFAKLAILGGIATIGLGDFAGSRLAPLDNEGMLGVLLGAGVIFVAYEGFELLPYDYEDIERPRRTLPLALYLSVAAVAAIYMAVTVGSQMLVSDSLISSQKEVAFAVVGREALGTPGFWAATLAAVLATASAINATLFSTSRLVRDVGAAGELPRMVTREKAGLPAAAIAGLAAVGAAFALLPGITELVSFGSLTFLIVFALVNYLHARRTARSAVDRRLAYSGCGLCVAAAIGLVYYLAGHDPAALALVGVCAVAVVSARLAFERGRTATGDGPR